MRFDPRTLAGLLFFVGAVQFLLALVAAEGAWPDYSVSRDVISDLGVGPPAALFNASVFLEGACTVAGAYFVHRVHGKRWLSALFILSGAGAMGVGLFPLTFLVPHGVSAVIAFVFGAASAIAMYAVVPPPLRWLAVALGAVSLLAFALFAGGVTPGIGRGGMERMIVYPVLLWQAALGAHLMTPGVPAAAVPQGMEKT